MNNEYNSLLVEQKILVCLLQTNTPQVRAYIRRETAPDDFGTPLGLEVRTRMDTLLRNGRELGTALEFGQDPALSPEAKDFIRVIPSQRDKARKYTLDQVKGLVYKLKLFRNKRIFSEAAATVGELASGKVDDATLEKMTSVFQDTLSSARMDMDQQPMSHMGKGQTDEGVDAIINDILTYVPGNFIPTGLLALDKLMGGYERGNLVTFSGPSGGGKSALAMSTGVNQYRLGKKNVVYVSMEMTEKELWRRVLSNISGVKHDIIRMPEGLKDEPRRKMREAWKEFHNFGTENGCRFTVWDVKDAMFTPQKMESYLAPMMYDVIVIDYVTLFHSGKMEKWEMQLEYSRYLKALAKKLGCVIVLLTQLTNDEKIKYGRGILENTDYWLHWKWREDEEQLTGDVEIRLEKARHTKARKIMTKFDLDFMRIYTTDADPLSAVVGAGKEGAAAGDEYSDIFSNKTAV